MLITSPRLIATPKAGSSTLVGLVEPAGVMLGYLQSPLLNLRTLADGGLALAKGEFGEVGGALGTIVDRGYNPQGLGGVVYNSGQAMKAIT